MKKPSFRRSLIAGLFALGLLTQTGCVTRKVWEPSYFVPDKRPNVRLYESTDPPGVIVEYDERIAGGQRTGRRAYLLEGGDPKPMPPGSVVRFVPPVQAASGLKSIPICSPKLPESWPTSGRFAVMWSDDVEFVLHRDGVVQGTCKLPFYRKTSHTFARALLTPGAVVTDAAFVAGVWGTIVGGTAAAAYAGAPIDPRSFWK